MTSYFGNGPYCYSNAVSMLLSSIGDTVPPADVEVLTGMGHGAFYMEKPGLLFFSDYHSSPDTGVTFALTQLGYDFVETSCESPDHPPFDDLEDALRGGPAILGPLDMSRLKYNPSHMHLRGADHFVLAYDIDDRDVYLHDPEGFPFVQLSLDDMAQAWRADSVDYKRGHFRCWHSPTKTRRPGSEDLLDAVLGQMKAAYSRSDAPKSVRTGEDAILMCAAVLDEDPAPESLKAHLLHFALKLGARRAADYADFFRGSRPKLSELKSRQAALFGRCHSNAATDDWTMASDDLRALARMEQRIGQAVLE